MADKTTIEWTDATWNPIVGCSIVSKGCTNCYAMRVAGARTSHTAKYTGLTQPSKGGPVWTGEVRLWEKALTQPLSWREPRRVFVNSMGDLFHEAIPDEWIDRCFAVMALAPQHTFQILTKRPERMRAYFEGDREEAVWQARFVVAPANGHYHADWPLPNCWLGVSAEDQATADERIPILLDTPAAVHFISAEPLLGAIDLRDIVRVDDRGFRHRADQDLDWVIVGGESGRGARPMHPAWARSLRDQCHEAGVQFFFKQWGEWRPPGSTEDYDTSGHVPGLPRALLVSNDGTVHHFGETAGEGAKVALRIGKKAAGRLLDGREWNEFPEAQT